MVIGVTDEKKVVGIEREGFDSLDSYSRHLVQIINNKFSKVIVSNYITIEIIKINDLSVCVVKCKDGTKDIIYLDGKVFARTGPRTDELSVEDVVNLYKEKSTYINS